MLILVRHAMPAYTPEIPAHDWELAPDGRAAAEQLARELPEDAYLVASTEPKAWQTLAPAGRPVVRDPRLCEVSRVEPWEGTFRQLRRSYVEGTEHPGWEPHAAVAARFEAAIAAHRAAAGGRPVVAASHGMAMTLWLTSHGLLPDPGEFWSRLRFPDTYRVASPDNTAAHD